MKRFFLTFTVAPEIVGNYPLSVATSNFSFNLASSGAFDKVYSILPYAIKGILPNSINEDNRYNVIYCKKLRKHGRFLRKLSVFIEQYHLFKLIPSKSSIWFYNMGDMSFGFYVLMKLFKPSCLLNVIVLDYTPPVSLFDRKRIYMRLINKAHGNILLSTSDRFTCKNKAILAGVVPNNCKEEPQIQVVNRTFLLSGVLSETIAQTNLVLSTFAKMPNCVLHITGFTSNDTIIKKYSTQHSNIIYHSKVSYEDYIRLLHECTYVLSTRNPHSPENQCNFPSKIIESLLHNRIVVSTISYPQLGNIKYIKVDSEPTAFLHDLLKIVSLPESELLGYANQGSLARKCFGTSVWVDTMSQIESEGVKK